MSDDVDALCQAVDRLTAWRDCPAKPRPGRQELIDCLDVIVGLAQILNDRLPVKHETPNEPDDADSRRGYL
jgi:hypothetical protein